ncbi:HEPN domain-containing protein [Snuella sedimenti]|uniref:HEPN domain-containing protein n=1 Tax=Snuella sedimenti TaxID=2798802 RepID=A0A8J7J4K2_9FLAO|nr:HEPN domain-containing protein [Snuella sedimenti]MBJ6368579.1 HEPN domain-containing protein [Snuella sedimenti]
MSNAKKWIDIAINDLKASEILYNNEHFSQSYFYFQQATEKANKAYWLLNGVLKEGDFKKISHNQLKPLRKSISNQISDFDLLDSLDEKFSFITENPLFENINLLEQKQNLQFTLSHIDKIHNQKDMDFDESEIKEFLNVLGELESFRLEFPENFSSIFRKNLNLLIKWFENFDTPKAKESIEALNEVLNDDFDSFILVVKDICINMIELAYATFVLIICSFLTNKHSNSTRYPEELNGQSPLDFYNNNLSIVRYQSYFIKHLETALSKLKSLKINENNEESNYIDLNSKLREEFNTPDTRWDIFGCKTKSDFTSYFIVKKNTHSKVPENIIQELEIAEQLQSFSYYYYPIYGDAFSRLTRIFEIAIKTKAKQESINFRKNTPLVRLIKDISNEYDEEFKNGLDWARKMRNMNAHPDFNTFYGNILVIPLIRMTNIINDIFRTKNYFDIQTNKFNQIKNSYQSYENGVWKFDKYLIHKIEILAFKNGLTLWAFYPVMKTYPQKRDDVYILEPFYSILNSHKKSGEDFIGTSFDNKKLELKKSDKLEDINSMESYLKQMNEAPEDVVQIMNMTANQKVFFQIENFKHYANLSDVS